MAAENSNGAVAVCNPVDIRYLTGVQEGISWLLVTKEHTLAISRHMLIHEVREMIPDCEVILPSERSTDFLLLEPLLLAQCVRMGVDSLIIDTSKVSAETHSRLQAAAREASLEIVVSNGLVDKLRAVKDGWELSLIRRCTEISEEALTLLAARGAGGFIGKSEREVALELERLMIDMGADRQGFPGTGIIVASGPNSASAHHSPGLRIIRAGEPLLIDWGAELSGYRSDMTRTFFLGVIPEFGKRIYPVVEEALQVSAALLGPETVMGDVDRAARGVVTTAGFAEFDYGVGHGLGLDIHELPWLRYISQEKLRTGMVTTIEPGIYLRGTGGVRIENLYHITESGVEWLGKMPFSLESMLLV